MDYEKHDNALASRMRLLDKAADTQLARELMQLHKKKCTECQEDRLGCTVRPACKDRNFLIMLIELGVEPPDLPSFCYSQYLDQVKRFIIERKGRDMIDRKIPIKDLLSVLNMGSIRQFTTRFSKIWSRSSTVREDNVMIVIGDELLFHFDFARGIVTLNPDHFAIGDFHLLKLYMNLLSEHNGLTSRVSDTTRNWWVMSLDMLGERSEDELQSLSLLLDNRIESMNVSSSNGGVSLQIEIIEDGHVPHFEVGDLKRVFAFASKPGRETRA
jgi:hypothetical protein